MLHRCRSAAKRGSAADRSGLLLILYSPAAGASEPTPSLNASTLGAGAQLSGNQRRLRASKGAPSDGVLRLARALAAPTARLTSLSCRPTSGAK